MKAVPNASSFSQLLLLHVSFAKKTIPECMAKKSYEMTDKVREVLFICSLTKQTKNVTDLAALRSLSSVFWFVFLQCDDLMDL